MQTAKPKGVNTMLVIKTDKTNRTATIELSSYEMDPIIDQYDRRAGLYLRENCLEQAGYWADRAKEFKEVQDLLTRKK